MLFRVSITDQFLFTVPRHDSGADRRRTLTLYDCYGLHDGASTHRTWTGHSTPLSTSAPPPGRMTTEL